MLNTHSVCVLLPEKIAFMNDGLFSATILPTYGKRGSKRAETQETFGRLSVHITEVTPIPSGANRSPGVQKRDGWHRYEEQNSHISWTRNPKCSLPSSKED